MFKQITRKTNVPLTRNCINHSSITFSLSSIGQNDPKGIYMNVTLYTIFLERKYMDIIDLSENDISFLFLCVAWLGKTFCPIDCLNSTILTVQHFPTLTLSLLIVLFFFYYYH